MYGEAKVLRTGAAAKASLNRASSRTRQTRSLSDLPMARLKRG